jgi:putative transposase
MLCDTALGGRPERHRRRTMVDALFCVLDNGIKWRPLPGDFPPWQTVYGLFARWRDDGVLARVRDRLRAAVRRDAGRHPEPSGAVMDSQPAAGSAEGVVPAAAGGFDHFTTVNGRKRHLLAGTLGLLVAVVATGAGAAGRDAAPALLARGRRRSRRLAAAWAGNAYHGSCQHWARQELGITVEIAPRPDPGKGRKGRGFRAGPRRRVVERTNAWVSRRRRARDYERLPETHAAMVNLAAIFQMTRRAAKPAA